jgi:hypothetical protein
LSESVPVGTSVAIVTASDADVGSNGLVYYSLVPAQVDSEDVKYFEINSETGLVTTVKILDYEKQSEFNVIAIATDGGQNKHFTTAPIHIILQDLNDNRPYFEQQSYDCIIFDQSSSSYVVKWKELSDLSVDICEKLGPYFLQQWSIVGFLHYKNLGQRPSP